MEPENERDIARKFFLMISKIHPTRRSLRLEVLLGSLTRSREYYYHTGVGWVEPGTAITGPSTLEIQRSMEMAAWFNKFSIGCL
jgi:hypothetical protein